LQTIACFLKGRSNKMNIARFSVVTAVFLCTSAAGSPAADSSEAITAARVKAGDEALFSQAHDAEAAYRQRLAKLRRLRHLAQEDGSADRLAELDGLYKRLRTAHDNRIGRIRHRMDAAAHARLDARLNEGRERFEWRQEAREQRFEKQQAARDARFENRQDAKQQRMEHRQEARQEHFDQRQAKRGERFEYRQHARQERIEQRQDVRQQHFDQREATRGERFDQRQTKRGEHFDQRQGKRGERFDQRQTKRGEHFEQRQAKRGEHFNQRQTARVERFDNRQARKQDHFEHRQARKAEAEAEWRAARARAAAKVKSRGPRQGASVEHSAGRWRAEAKDRVNTQRHRADRWRKAATRNGILPEGGADNRGAKRRGRLLSQREADDAAGRSISRKNADAELKRLRQDGLRGVPCFAPAPPGAGKACDRQLTSGMLCPSTCGGREQSMAPDLNKYETR
jgi:hypothetical protein